MIFEYPAGATPIDPDEAAGLIPAHVTLQRELNEYEGANILAATEWTFARKLNIDLTRQKRSPRAITIVSLPSTSFRTETADTRD